MDLNSEHLKKLSKARERVIAECRKLSALNGPHEHRRLEELDQGSIAVQNTIDEINRLLGGKTPIASAKLLSFPTRTLQQPATMKTNDGSMAAQSAPRSTPAQLRTRKVSRF
jgi:hypothetical protein